MAMVGYDASVEAIIKHRKANPEISARYNLSTDYNTVSEELWQYTKTRLGITADPPGGAALPKPLPPRQARHVAGAVAGGGANRGFVQRIQTAGSNLKRAAQGTAVVVDWLMSGGNAVAPELAERRAGICVACPKNVPGSWYTVAPAQLIKETLEARKDLTLATSHDAELKSCDVCRCLMRLKVWVPLEPILKNTSPAILAEFPPNCWIAKRDQ